MPEIAVVRAHDWHRPMLEPLVGPLARLADVAVWSPQSFVRWSQAGGPAPDVVIVADAGIVAGLRAARAGPTYVHVGHGLISKRQAEYYYREPDHICLAGEATAARLTALGHTPRRSFWVTGLVQADPLFRDPGGGEIRRVEGSRATILYAPTWNPTLSSADMLGDRLVTLLRGDDETLGIIIKPHPHTPVARPDWMARWRAAASSQPHVELAEPADDLVPFLKGASLLVSDASSAVFHFLVLDRPVVLLDNPARFSDPGVFDADGIEWRWRDFADSVVEVEALAGVVRRALEQPDRLAARRMHYRSALYGEHADGRAVERIVGHIAALLERRAA